MAKRFQFDDEDFNEEREQTSHIDELEKIKKEAVSNQFEDTQQYTQFNDEDEEELMSKNKKFTWKWWHYLLIVFGVLFIALMLYVFVLSNNDGPVYGNRCQGIATIPQNYMETTKTDIKKKYTDVKDISFEITCKQLKVDMVFKDSMNTKKAQTIAEDAVQMLDKAVGKPKDKGKAYSQLFGYENNVAQFEVNLFLESSNSQDFPVYGTKHVSKDDFSYTLSSVKDKESKEKAESTLKK